MVQIRAGRAVQGVSRIRRGSQREQGTLTFRRHCSIDLGLDGGNGRRVQQSRRLYRFHRLRVDLHAQGQQPAPRRHLQRWR